MNKEEQENVNKITSHPFFSIITLKSIEWKMYKRCQFGFHIKDKRQVRQNQKRQEKNRNLVKWRNLCVCVSVNMYQAVMK